MTPVEFINKWSDTGLRERAGAQSHFIDLCQVLGEKPPTDADPRGEWYAFEKGVMKTGGGDGWADVWKRGCFAWEYKSPGKDLNAALRQLQYYVRSLENPPLLVVSDMERIELHTNWTNTVQDVHTFSLPELADAGRRQFLKKAFSETEVEELKPGKTREALTKEVAEEFVELAQSLRERGHDAEKVAHFINRLVFCMFAEDVDLLPDRLFKRMLEASLKEPEKFTKNAQNLFAAMRGGGHVGFTAIDWFNGGIFDDDTALPLTRADIKVALQAANRNWSNIDPSIMGTLFERGLDPGKRSQLGAHYTDPDKIMLIVNPVIAEPLTREWEELKPRIGASMERARTHRDPSQRTRSANEAKRQKAEFIERLKNFRVLDPACGSGNFLYLALKELKSIEHRVNVECEQMGLGRGFPAVGPECVKGIEVNPFAAELARVSVWIGEIQWMREHGFDASRDPILKPLQTIECRDALLNANGGEAEWPEADVIIGNPPFLGTQLMIGTLGEEYVGRVRATYSDATDGAVDLVTYWFVRAWDAVRQGRSQRAGFVGTQSIRRGASRALLKRIVESGSIFDAWQDEPWVVEGAAVRVSLVCFQGSKALTLKLDGEPVSVIHSDLTSLNDISSAEQLPENSGSAFQGTTKAGAFDVERETAVEWLLVPNPNNRPNSDVLRPWVNGADVTDRNSGHWIIDFGTSMSERDAALYVAPFEHLRVYVRPARVRLRREAYRRNWWIHAEARPGLRRALAALKERFIVTPRVAKHRLFIWLSKSVLPDTRLVVIAREDDTTFGILHSRYHELWSLRQGGRHGVGNDPQYTPSLGFETFPFPAGLTPDIPTAQYACDPRANAIATAAAELSMKRENWLNPPDLVQRVPEVVPGYPDRIVPVDEKAAALLKKRTLTNLYNERPAWLDHAHRELDAAVAAAYGWPADLTDEQILERLFQLNQARAARAMTGVGC